MPSKYESGGRKRHQNGKMTAKSAATQIGLKKSGGRKCRQNMKVVAESAPKTAKWWQKVPPLLKCGGTKRWNKNHHISNCG